MVMRKRENLKLFPLILPFVTTDKTDVTDDSQDD